MIFFSFFFFKLQICKVAEEELQKYREKKLSELNKLEMEYQNALKDVGMGHESVEEELRFLAQRSQHNLRQREVAEVRGEHALKVVAHQNSLKVKLEDERRNLMKSVKLTEDARAADIRMKGCEKENVVASAKIIEITMPNEVQEKRVRFSDFDRPISGVVVKAVDKVTNKIGVEAAIREELERRQSIVDQRKAARNRGLSVVKRAQMPRHQVITSSFFDDSTTTEEEKSESAQYSGMDLQDSQRLESQSDASSSLHATVRQEDMDIQHSTLPCTRQLEGLVVGSPRHPSTKALPLSHPHPNSKNDQDFVAKVLEGLELPVVGEMQVNVRVDEVSTFASSTAESKDSLSSSSDITKERFLSEAWKNQDIQGLIGEFRSKSQSSPQQNCLKGYIERLLEMKRDEIEDLSATDSLVTSPSSSSSTQNTTPFASSTPSSILSSGSSRGSKNKSVRFIDQPDNVGGSFIASKDNEKVSQALQNTDSLRVDHGPILIL